MKNVFKSPQILMVAGFLIIAVTAVAWQNNDNKNKKDTASGSYTQGDTTRPGKRSNDKDELRMKDLDQAMKELDIQLKELDVQLNGLDLQLSKELKKAFAEIDFDEINKEIQKELKNVDAEQISKDVERELKKIDVEKIKTDVANSLKEASEEMKNVDKVQLEKDMKELKLKLNSPEFKKGIEDAMEKAKIGIEKAKKELLQLKEFTDGLQKDGLIDKKKGYSIEWKNGGELFINGNKQPKEVSDKYRKYYKKDGYKINMNNDEEEEGESM